MAHLRALTPEAARAIDRVEILVPLPQLEKINIVDTPGLNSIQPEHEATARAFIARADAVVWVFTAAQGGKASEKKALRVDPRRGQARARRAQQGRPAVGDARSTRSSTFIGGELGELRRDDRAVLGARARSTWKKQSRATQRARATTATGARSPARSRSGSSSRRASSSATRARAPARRDRRGAALASTRHAQRADRGRRCRTRARATS